MVITTLKKDGMSYLRELRENGTLGEPDVVSFGKLLGWNTENGRFDLKQLGTIQGDAYWELLLEFLSVMEYRDTVYPQPDRGALESYRMGALPLFAEKRRWKSHFLAKNEPVSLVILMLQSLWYRRHDKNMNALKACGSIYTQWTRRKLDVMAPIATLEEKMGKTFFGDAWWHLYCDNDDDSLVLYNLVRQERPQVLSRLMSQRPQRVLQVDLPNDADFTQST